MITITTALLAICIFCFGLNYDAGKHQTKPKRKRRYHEPVDKADETNMYGNWMYPDLHRKKKIQEFIKEYNNL